MKNTKIWDIIAYITLALIIIGQVTIGFNFWVGQIAYLLANIGTVARCFTIKLPTANKVRDVVITAIGIGVMIVKGCLM